MEPTTAITKTSDRLSGLIQSSAIKSRFDEVLGKRSSAFTSSIISAVSANPALRNCEPMSVISAAMIAAQLDLPINPSLGLAHIVPYGESAQFQIGWKGIVQLAMRSGQYKTIHTTEVYEGQIKNHDPFTGLIEFNKEASSDSVIGYLLYFKLLNGYEKYFYMTKEQCETHGKKYSKLYQRGKGQWADNFDTMALKTVVKQGLTKYGILSIDVQQAIEADQKVLDETGEGHYLDAPKTEVVEEKTKKKASRLDQIIDREVVEPPL